MFGVCIKMTIKEYQQLKNGTKLEITLRNGKSYTGKVETLCSGGIKSPKRYCKNLQISDSNSMLITENTFRDFKLIKGE